MSALFSPRMRNGIQVLIELFGFCLTSGRNRDVLWGRCGAGISTKINKENAIDDKQLRNTGLSNNYTAYGARETQLHTEPP
ncbi:hypothetical protein ACLKA6_002382 [Drosophila palustris]